MIFARPLPRAGIANPNNHTYASRGPRFPGFPSETNHCRLRRGEYAECAACIPAAAGPFYLMDKTMDKTINAIVDRVPLPALVQNSCLVEACLVEALELLARVTVSRILNPGDVVVKGEVILAFVEGSASISGSFDPESGEMLITGHAWDADGVKLAERVVKIWAGMFPACIYLASSAMIARSAGVSVRFTESEWGLTMHVELAVP